MIVKTNYADVKENVSISVNDGQRDIKSLYKVVITRDNAEEAIQKLKNSASVIAFQFESVDIANDLMWLAQTYPVFIGKPIIFVVSLRDREPSAITYEELSQIARMSNPGNIETPAVRLVFKCPNEHNDVALVYRLSIEFKNVFFCGGYYLNHKFCNLGCIKETDFPNKVSNKMLPVTNGCVCNNAEVAPDFHTVDFDSTELVYSAPKNNGTTEKVVRAKTKTASTAPKKVTKPSTSLFSLGGDMLGGF